MKSRATAKHYPFPYLKDGASKVARAFGARVTPHIFVIDPSGVVRYRGYVDDSAKPEERQHAGLKDALDSLLAGNAGGTLVSADRIGGTLNCLANDPAPVDNGLTNTSVGKGGQCGTL